MQLGYDIGVGIFIVLIVVDATVSVIFKRRKLDWVYAIAMWCIFIYFLLRIGGIV